jgi:hypothetical protein
MYPHSRLLTISRESLIADDLLVSRALVPASERKREGMPGGVTAAT